jgi:hypothetical protein
VLLPDELLIGALLLDHATSSGVALVDGFVFDSGDGPQMIGRVLEGRRIMERVAKVARVPALLPAYL